MNFYQMMRTTNKLMNQGIKELNKNDVELMFGKTADEHLKSELEYLGYTVNYVADLFNAKLPERKFTRDEMNKQKESEKWFNKMLG